MKKTISWLLSLPLAVFALCASALELEGPFTQGGLLHGQLESGQQVQFDGVTLPLTKENRFIVGLDRDFKSPLELTLVHADGSQEIKQFQINARDYRIQKIEGISKKIMSPNADDIARSRKEAGFVRSARDHDLETPYYEAGFKWPLIGPITGVYGSQRVYNGVPKRPHYGVDVAAPTGTPVTAPAPGIVRLAYENMFFSGGTLIIDHGYGLSSSFLHLSKMLVEEGDYVDASTQVALVGATGRVTGPHLDWRMNWRNQRIDPQLLVPDMPKK